jgi:hypothetical protein
VRQEVNYENSLIILAEPQPGGDDSTVTLHLTSAFCISLLVQHWLKKRVMRRSFCERLQVDCHSVK